MSGTVTPLPQVIPDPPESTGEGNEDHPMRRVTRQVAFEPGGWTPERAAKVAQLFDELAPEWHTRLDEHRMRSLVDALDRGGVAPPGGIPRRVVELGAGTGFGTAHLVERFPHVVALDLSGEMLSRNTVGAARVRGDSSALPFAAGAADVLVLVNMLLFPAEVDRVLAAEGALVWVNSLAERTPIYLSAEDVVAALPGRWEAVASRAAGGSWCVARRSRG